MKREQKGPEDTPTLLQVTYHEVLAMNHVLSTFLQTQERQPTGSQEHPEVVKLVRQFYYRIGGSSLEREFKAKWGKK